jgi:hypothetical protein
MLGSRLWLTVLVSAALLAAQTSPAAAAPIVFDFEDGTQGWSLLGSAQRVQTQVLGGEWAIFGDGLVGAGGGGGASLTMWLDLTRISSISLDMFYLGNFDDRIPYVIRMWLLPAPDRMFAVPRLLRPRPIENPGTWVYDVAPFAGIGRLWLRWGVGILCIPEDPDCPPELPKDSLIALIDNITFHPVPEPGTLVLLAFSLVTLAVVTRRLEGIIERNRTG